MFEFLKKSIDLANNYDYLDRLFSVYPVFSNIRRNINNNTIDKLKKYYNNQDNYNLIKEALKLELFPIKDSYTAYLKKFPESIDKNPQTINRISGTLYEMGWDKFMEKITEPKESNRQMGNMFQNWINKKVLGILPVDINNFMRDNKNAILKCSESDTIQFAEEMFGYKRNKGLDFIARFNGKYIIGEAKFLTDFGGHQNAQFEDAMLTLNSEVKNAITIAILDGVLYGKSNNKIHKYITETYKNKNILSALLLKDFLYQI